MEELRKEISLLSRANTDCAKWDGLSFTFGQKDLLPLWVADMDFKVAPCIRQALHEAVDQGAFGYYQIPDRFYDSVLTWERTRHDNLLQREWLRTTPGVVTGLYHLVRALTQPGDGVMVQPPVYYPFYRIIRQTGRTVICNHLKEDRGVYTLDLEDFEAKLRTGEVKVFLLCSPHNPVGRVWTRKELKGMLDLCKEYGVQVVADEIHHDIIMPGHTHIPAATLWEGEGKPITFFSASKTFNLAAMKNSILVLPEESQREKFDQFEKELGTGLGSTLDYIAVMAAFAGGAPWLETVLAEIWGNYQFMKQELEEIPSVVVSPLEGSYLMWIDLGAHVSRENIQSFVQDTCRIAPDYGHWFFPEESDDCHIRLNLAAPRETIRKAAEQIKTALNHVLGG